MTVLYILTAPGEAGKTTFCRALAEQARSAGWDVAGLLSPAVFDNDVKTGILAENLRTGETRPLAIANLQPSNFPTFNLSLGNWIFDSSIIAWGNQVLETSLPCDLFIVDEIGPLELLRGEGWINALEALRESSYKVGIVVIRPELVETVCQMFPARKTLLLFSPPINAQKFFLSLQGA